MMQVVFTRARWSIRSKVLVLSEQALFNKKSEQAEINASLLKLNLGQ